MTPPEGRTPYSTPELSALSGISQSTIRRRVSALTEPYRYKRRIWLTPEQFETVTAPFMPSKEKHPVFQIAGKQQYTNQALAAYAGVGQGTISIRLKAFSQCKYGKWTFLSDEEFTQVTRPGSTRRTPDKFPEPPRLSGSMVSNEAGEAAVSQPPQDGKRRGDTALPPDPFAGIKQRAREELAQELEAWGRLYDRFGEAHIRRMAQQGISPLRN